MAMDDDQSEIDTPDEASEERRRETELAIRDLLDAGWQWSESEKGLLMHPSDKELTVWHDPYSHELLHSPKLVESLKRQLKDGAR